MYTVDVDALKIDSIPDEPNNLVTLKLTGPFTLNSVFEFQSLIRNTKDQSMIVDLSDVPYLDSAALGSLVSIHVTSQAKNRKYALVGASERLLTLFKMSQVYEVLHFYPTVAEAKTAFAAAKP